MDVKALVVCLVLLLACRKDPSLVYDNYVHIDGTIYFRPQNSNGSYNSSVFSPYYTAVYWKDDYENKKISINVGNTCDNNRGNLSNYRGFIDLQIWKGKDSSQYYGIFPLFELKYVEKKLFIEYSNLKVYRVKTFNYGPLDSTNYKIISGRATFK